jgi:monothiol glutaredoxin
LRYGSFEKAAAKAFTLETLLKKWCSMKNELKERISSLISSKSIVLFMKGTKDRPQCGFSKQVIDILCHLVNDFATVDVLADPELREGIKVYSSWPTIPQLYIDGEFIGGSDIVRDLYNKNELASLLKIQKASCPPIIHLSPDALAAFKKAHLEQQSDEIIRLSIDARFAHGLGFDKKRPDDFCLGFDDLEIIIDPYSASRATNLTIDFVTNHLDAGFSFDNPNEPLPVKELAAEDLKAWQDRKEEILLIDVRTKPEWNKAHISSARLLCEMTKEEIASIRKDQKIIFHCHHGGRSKRMAEEWHARGFTQLYNLTGGIDAWSRKVDPSVPIYTN